MAVMLLVVALFIFMIGQMAVSQFRESQREEIQYSEFLDMLEKGEVGTVLVKTDGTIEITKKGTEKNIIKMTYYTGQFNDPDLIQRLDDAGVTFKREIQKTT